MISGFVLGLREGLEVALVIGVLMAYLVRSDRRSEIRLVWLALVLAVVCCVIIGIVLYGSMSPQGSNPRLDYFLGFLAVALLTSVVLSRHKILNPSVGSILGFTFVDVFREGLELVIFVLALDRTTDTSGLSAGGALLGVLVAGGVGVVAYRRGSKTAKLERLFLATTVCIAIVAGALFGHVLDEVLHLSDGVVVAISIAYTIPLIVHAAMVRARAEV